ncbi:MAG: YggT family protein [Alphaproteobacteria bacterium]
MDVLVGPFLYIVDMALGLYMWALIISAIMSWLVAFNVVNTHNRMIYMVGDFLYRITEPALRPIRRVVPVMGGMDLSPMVLIFVVIFLREVVARLAFRLL